MSVTGPDLAPAARRIAVINPNGTEAMTDKAARAARAAVDPATAIWGITNRSGPAAIESHYDEAVAVPGLLAEVTAAEQAGADGFVIACFGDPGLDAAREVATGPVVGIAEAGFHVASMLGRSFSIVTTLARTIGQAEHLVRRYGFTDRCCSIYACEVAVLALDDPASEARKIVLDHCRRAVECDQADSIVLGCAGMADFCVDLSEQLGVPVVDGVAAAAVLVEGMVKLGLRTSTRCEYAAPPVRLERR